MAEVFPFRGVVYNKQKIANLSSVMTPPYDVISAEMQENYYGQHAYNFVRVDFGKVFSEDNEQNNRYTRAAAELDRWVREGILIRQERSSFYVYEQQFTWGEKTFKRIGFVGLLRLEEFGKGKVVPHEKTLEGPKADRLKLMRATSAHLSQVFQLYSDPQKLVDRELKKIARNKPDIEVTDEDGVIHRVWIVDSEKTLGRIRELMKDKALFIADGHHRYETAVNYRNEMRATAGGAATVNEPYDFAPMMFVNMESRGLVIFPTHRFVYGLAQLRPEEFLQKCSQMFDVSLFELSAGARAEVTAKLARLGSRGQAFVAYLGQGKGAYLVLKDPSLALKFGDASRSKEWRLLDVSILHTLLLQRVLAIGTELVEKHIKYTRDDEEAFAAVDSGKYQASFLMNATSIEEVKQIAANFEVMPQKSTYFYPKLRSGLVLNRIVPGEQIT